VRLAAVIPATDDPPHLSTCLTAIAAADEPPDEILVVHGPVASGAAAARNVGAQATNCEVLVFVDSDVVVHPDAFTRIRRWFAADPRVDAVFGAYDDRPNGGGATTTFRNLLHHYVHTESPGDAVTFWSAIGALRRDAFVAVGGFDQSRYPRVSIEDIELGARLRRAGFRLRLDPAIQGTHLKSWTLRSMVVTDVVRRGIPWIHLMLRDRHVPTTLNLSWRHRVSTVACVVGSAAVVRGRSGLALGATGVLVAVHGRLYRLLFRRGGVPLVVAGLALHVLHHLAGLAAVPLGVGGWLVGRRPRGSARVATARAGARVGMAVTRLTPDDLPGDREAMALATC
jgi:Glycosyl transferase family group 2